VTIPSLGHLPTDPVARGHWLALQRVLNPDESWLHLPQDVEWPVDVGELVNRALPESGDRFVALREHGVHSTKR
jgi:hypothetical protein